MNDEFYPKNLPERQTPRGKKPKLLSDDKVKVLLSTPNTWYVIGTSKKWMSGSLNNIKTMSQANLVNLHGIGRFELSQRKNDNDMVDIYCRWIPNDYLEEE
jgi:hypothetical protein|tara:strand:+ start:4535 stop:4837 length:303 start_codon:yes stop_codon:yes gene_type:complete